MTEQEFLATVSRSVDLRVSGDLAGAVQLASAACDARPDQPSAWHTLAMADADLGRHAEALYCRARAVDLLDALAIHTAIPDEQCHAVQQCVFGYATSLLLAGEWEAAWPFWEIGRLGYSWTPLQGSCYWQGQTDGNLLVVCEGGYGDLFLFSRFLPLLRRRLDEVAVLEGGPLVGLVVQRGLGSFRDWKALGVNFVYEIGDPIPLGVWKYSTSIMSLPGQLGIKSIADVPGDALPDPIGIDFWGGIGFCWRSEENQTKRRYRSLPVEDAAWIAGRLAGDGDSGMPPIHSLSPSRMDLSGKRDFEQPSDTVYYPGRLKNWQATARYIAGMTMVLTVDTAVAHLAGLLGVPTLLLLPLNVDWRWGLTDDRTPWYPSVRLFRNQDPLQWERERIVETALAMYQEVSQ